MWHFILKNELKIAWLRGATTAHNLLLSLQVVSYFSSLELSKELALPRIPRPRLHGVTECERKKLKKCCKCVLSSLSLLTCSLLKCSDKCLAGWDLCPWPYNHISLSGFSGWTLGVYGPHPNFLRITVGDGLFIRMSNWSWLHISNEKYEKWIMEFNRKKWWKYKSSSEAVTEHLSYKPTYTTNWSSSQDPLRNLKKPLKMKCHNYNAWEEDSNITCLKTSTD